MKYEERVEIGERWSKPHVSTTSLRGLQMFRDALINKSCCVGLGQTLPEGDCQIAGISNKYPKLYVKRLHRRRVHCFTDRIVHNKGAPVSTQKCPVS